MCITSILPNEILVLGISLEPEGINTLAWKYKDAINLVKYCRTHDIAILGGDVFRQIHGNRYQHTYDTWYLETDGYSAWDEYVDASCKHTFDKINTFSILGKDEGIVFSIVTASRDSKYNVFENGHKQ